MRIFLALIRMNEILAAVTNYRRGLLLSANICNKKGKGSSDFKQTDMCLGVRDLGFALFIFLFKLKQTCIYYGWGIQILLFFRSTINQLHDGRSSLSSSGTRFLQLYVVCLHKLLNKNDLGTAKMQMSLTLLQRFQLSRSGY